MDSVWIFSLFVNRMRQQSVICHACGICMYVFNWKVRNTFRQLILILMCLQVVILLWTLMWLIFLLC